MRIIILIWSFLLILTACGTRTARVTERPNNSFKVIGYIQGHHIDTSAIAFDKLTHVNFAFAIPAPRGGTLDTLHNAISLQALVKSAHNHRVQVFISIGGWGIGDGGGDDTRFHRLAEVQGERTTFIHESMNLVRQYNLDGIDLDWEYPDPDTRSADDYAALMNELADSLHAHSKQLSAAIVHYGRQGDGIKKEVFESADWLNLMAYDDDNGKRIPHSPYTLAEKSIHYWVDERGLPPAKAILGLPLYGKPWNKISDYKLLLEAGADANADEFDSIYYNGIPTIKKKTSLAKAKGLGGVMIWEISADANDERSLLKAINEVKNANRESD